MLRRGSIPTVFDSKEQLKAYLDSRRQANADVPFFVECYFQVLEDNKKERPFEFANGSEIDKKSKIEFESSYRELISTSPLKSEQWSFSDEVIGSIQNTIKNLTNIRKIHQQFDDYWTWAASQNMSIPDEAQRNAIKEYLSVGFAFRMGSKHTASGAKDAMQGAEFLLQISKYLYETTLQGVFEHIKDSLVGDVPKSKSDRIIRLAKGEAGDVKDLSAALKNELDEIKKSRLFVLMPEERKVEAMNKLCERLLEACKGNEKTEATVNEIVAGIRRGEWKIESAAAPIGAPASAEGFFGSSTRSQSEMPSSAGAAAAAAVSSKPRSTSLPAQLKADAKLIEKMNKHKQKMPKWFEMNKQNDLIEFIQKYSRTIRAQYSEAISEQLLTGSANFNGLMRVQAHFNNIMLILDGKANTGAAASFDLDGELHNLSVALDAVNRDMEYLKNHASFKASASDSSIRTWYNENKPMFKEMEKLNSTILDIIDLRKKQAAPAQKNLGVKH